MRGDAAGGAALVTFQPFVPVGGLVGWRYLKRTLPMQQEAFARQPILRRDLDDFRDRIGQVRTAQALVSDYRLLRVALGAFGLSDDIASKHLIRTVLEEGTLKPDALANRLSDKRYRDLSRAFGFGDFPVPNTALSDFADRIAARYTRLSFEEAVGRGDETMRLALNAEREMTSLAAETGSDRTRWFRLMGTPPLRKVFEEALGLPASFGALDLDRQLGEFRARAAARFGTGEIAELAEPQTLGRILDRFAAIRGAAQSAQTVTSPALVLLRGY
jgi:hypothetical protein